MIRLLSGNEAVARGAWEAGVTVASAYPGTPSTEILEEFARFPNVYAEWAANEKVAVDVAVGAAYMGKRALATMKHVGLNVAADSFMYASMTGIEAGLVIVTAYDPAMHSSQNEQDNRTFAKFGRVPCLEPADSQEAKDLTIAAFDLSEQFDTPVLLRLTTRVCHSTSAVKLETGYWILDTGYWKPESRSHPLATSFQLLATSFQPRSFRATPPNTSWFPATRSSGIRSSRRGFGRSRNTPRHVPLIGLKRGRRDWGLSRAAWPISTLKRSSQPPPCSSWA